MFTLIDLFDSRNKVVACAKHFVGDGGTDKGINEGYTIASMTWRRFTWHLIWTVFLREIAQLWHRTRAGMETKCTLLLRVCIFARFIT